MSSTSETQAAIERAIQAAGGQASLARACGVKPQAVNQWVRSSRIPAERVLAVVAACRQQVAPHELRPDLYLAQQAA